MATIEKRVDALETSHGIGGGGGPRCPECGGLPIGEAYGPDYTWEIVFCETEEELEAQDQVCPACGKYIVHVIEFED